MRNDTIQMKAMVLISISMVRPSRSAIRSLTGTLSWQLRPKSQWNMPPTQWK